MKTKMAVLLIVAVVVLSLLVYASKKHASPHGATIVVLGEDSSNLSAYASLCDDFAIQTGIHVRIEGATFEQAMQKADADFRNGTGQYDVVLQYNFSLAPYVTNNYVAAINNIYSPSLLDASRVSEGMFENAVKETCFYYSNPRDITSPACQFGFPFAANTMLLVYNKDILEDAALNRAFKEVYGASIRVPADWESYVALAEFIGASSSDTSGVCLQGAADGWLYYELCNYLFGMGSGTSAKKYGWQEHAAITIATPQNERVLGYYRRLHSVSSGDFFTVDASRQREIMLQGKTAMAIMWSDYVQPLAESRSPRFGFSPIPGTRSGLAGGAFYVNRKSDHLQAASQFILYALAPENQSKLIGRGLCSPLRTAYTEQVMQSVPYARALRDSLDRGVFMFEAGRDAGIISNAVTAWTQRFIRGEISASDALVRCQEEVLAKRAAMP